MAGGEVKQYQLIEESYVHGIMKGEVFEKEDFYVEEITLV